MAWRVPRCSPEIPDEPGAPFADSVWEASPRRLLRPRPSNQVPENRAIQSAWDFSWPLAPPTCSVLELDFPLPCGEGVTVILLYFLEVPAGLPLSEGGGRDSLTPLGCTSPGCRRCCPASRYGQCLSFTCDSAHSPSSALPHGHLLFLVPGDPGGLHRWLHLRTRPPGEHCGATGPPSASPDRLERSQFQGFSGGILPRAGGRDPFLPGCALPCMISLTLPNTHLTSDHPQGLPIQ